LLNLAALNEQFTNPLVQVASPKCARSGNL
jgi:hypothetical protein